MCRCIDAEFFRLKVPCFIGGKLFCCFESSIGEFWPVWVLFEAVFFCSDIREFQSVGLCFCCFAHVAVSVGLV